jgi:hypothetical protein
MSQMAPADIYILFEYKRLHGTAYNFWAQAFQVQWYEGFESICCDHPDAQKNEPAFIFICAKTLKN